VPFGNFTQLVAAIANWISRDGLNDPIAAHIPDWVTLFENRANNELRSRYAIVNTSIVANPTSPTPQLIPLPSDYNGLVVAWNAAQNPSPSLYPAGSYLYPFAIKTPIQQVNDSNFYGLGMPWNYSIVGNNVVLGKTPDAAYVFGFSYYADLVSLADPANTSGTNWLLQHYPAIYLYGSLSASAPYLGEDNRETWEFRYKEGVRIAMLNERLEQYGGQAIAVRAI
jgi:hypothetical protein